MFTDENWIKAWHQGRIAWANRNPTCGDYDTDLQDTIKTDLPYNAHSQALWQAYQDGIDSLGIAQFAHAAGAPFEPVFPSIRVEAVRRLRGINETQVLHYAPNDRLASCDCHSLVWSKYDLTRPINRWNVVICPITVLETS